MRIVRRREVWAHTHFITDGERLTRRDMRRIEKEIVALLRRLGIVYGVHFREPEKNEGVHIVLECVPEKDRLEAIEAHLKSLIEPIPKRPTAVKIAAPRSVVERSKAAAEDPENLPASGPLFSDSIAIAPRKIDPADRKIR